jgi:hypothetical protein
MYSVFICVQKERQTGMPGNGYTISALEIKEVKIKKKKRVVCGVKGKMPISCQYTKYCGGIGIRRCELSFLPPAT